VAAGSAAANGRAAGATPPLTKLGTEKVFTYRNSAGKLQVGHSCCDDIPVCAAFHIPVQDRGWHFTAAVVTMLDSAASFHTWDGGALQPFDPAGRVSDFSSLLVRQTMNRRRSKIPSCWTLHIFRHPSRTLLTSPVCVCDPLLDAQGPFSLAQLAALVSNGLVGRETAVTHPTRGTAPLRLFLDQVRLPSLCRKPYWPCEYDVSTYLPAGPICAMTTMQNPRIWLANEPAGSHVLAGPPAATLLGPFSQRVRRAFIKQEGS